MYKTKTVEVILIHDEGESFYVLPSGFEDTHILVNESPVDLEVTHITEDRLRLLKATLEQG